MGECRRSESVSPGTPEGTPYARQRLLRRCLKKDRDECLHDVADAGLELKELLVDLSSAPPSPDRGRRWRGRRGGARGAWRSSPCWSWEWPRSAVSFFSPDGRFIGFGANDKLKKVAVDGGPIVALADAAQLRGGSWGEDGTILFTHGSGGLLRLAADGGDARRVTEPDPARHERNHRCRTFCRGPAPPSSTSCTPIIHTAHRRALLENDAHAIAVAPDGR